MNQYVINKQLLLSSGVRKLVVLSKPEDFNPEFHMTLAQEEELLSNAVEKVEAVVEEVSAIAVETTTEVSATAEDKLLTEAEDKLLTEKEEYEELKAGKVWLHGSDEKKARYKELKEIYG